MIRSTDPIGIFDSGLGGLTVLQQIAGLLPHEDLIYFGDTARVPYGNENPSTILRYTKECIHFLRHFNLKTLVIACNTAAAYAFDTLKEELDIPVINVIDSGIKQALSMTQSNGIAILGTRATINSGIYENKLKALRPSCYLISKACPLFVPLVEEDFAGHIATQKIIQEYLSQLPDHPIDTVILGCTHYPLLMPQISSFLGSHITLVNSAFSCALALKDHLIAFGLENKPQHNGYIRYFVTDDPEKFSRIGNQLLGLAIKEIELVDDLVQIAWIN